MKKNIILFLLLFLFFRLHSQIEDFVCHVDDSGNSNVQYAPAALSNTTYKSSNGRALPTQGVLRALTIFVNIIYDQNPSMDPFPASNNNWPVSNTNSINSPVYKPSYMLDLFDVEFQSSGNYIGTVTRKYAENSFNQFIILSDFVVVNIKQSQITPNTAGNSCSAATMRSAVIDYINNTGGLGAYYGHNDISDYDKVTAAGAGIEKAMIPDGKIDLVNFILRNSTNAYGGINNGSGATTYSEVSSLQIKVTDQYYGFSYRTYQCVGTGDDTKYKTSILVHEIAHLLLGDNSFHTSGGTTNNVSSHNTFIGKQHGHGLFAVYNGLLTCNAYERWRLGWRGPSNNAYPIASNNVNSDVAKFTGEKTFTLRDFVTYGDAIRIKLPYKDNPESSNQYIWLENHQCSKNNKIDGFVFSAPNTCRDADGIGIHAYYHVGRDTLEGTRVYYADEMDNLRMLSAEGNYNVTYEDNAIHDCFGWAVRPRFTYVSPNSLSGINDQNEVFKYTSSTSTILLSQMTYLGLKNKNNMLYTDLPYLGDQLDAFVPNPEIKMDISTNPAPVNTTTYYSIRNGSTMTVASNSSQRNTRKIYLTGLSIKMIDPQPDNTGMKSYTVKIRWDDYDVKQDVNWAGDIVLKEQLNLLQNKTIILEQNKTPFQINKYPVSGYFAPPTQLTCEDNSLMTLVSNSKIRITEKSSFILNSGSTLNIQDGAEIIVESGSTFMIKSGSNLNIHGNGKIMILSGGYLCVESGANISLQDYSSVIFLREGSILGVNPALFSSQCLSTIPFTGTGKVVNGNMDVYIQNETINSNRYVGGKNIYVGNYVTTAKTQGNVLITNNANIIFEAAENAVLDAGFECTKGATFEVRKNE